MILGSSMAHWLRKPQFASWTNWNFHFWLTAVGFSAQLAAMALSLFRLPLRVPDLAVVHPKLDVTPRKIC